MAYVAVSGGQEAIEESTRLLHCMRGSTFKELEVEAIEKKLGLLVDRVMSESGLYAPAYAALALKQAEGSIEEAVSLPLANFRAQDTDAGSLSCGILFRNIPDTGFGFLRSACVL